MQTSRLSSTLLLCFASFVSATLPAQQLPADVTVQKLPISPPPSSPASAASQYAGESAVIERSELIYAMNADGTGYREHSMAIRVQSEAAVRELGIVNVPFASASEKVEIQYVRVRRPDGTVLQTAVSAALEQPQAVTREAPFYSDLKQMQLPVKSLRAGDTLEWKVRITRTKAEAPGQFWSQDTFVSQGIALSEALELRVPKDTVVNVWTNPSLNLKPIEKIDGAQRVYRWESKSLKPTTGPEAEAEKKRKEKELWTADQELDAKEGALPSVAWTTFKSWEAVGAWYRGLEGDRMMPDDALKAKVAELTAGKTTLEEKVRAVYGFVGPQVRYIGVAFGVGRYQPHHAEEVLENQYGDCKDKHTLLAAMLTVLGLHPDAVLIGSGIRFNEAVPSPAAFNHLITHVMIDGKETWLDTTAEVAPYRMLNSTIRDKQALVVPETGAAKLEKTPADPPFPSFQTMKVEGTLTSDGTENSHVTLVARGDIELFLRAVLHQIPPAQYDAFAQKLWGGMNFNGTTSHADISRPEDTAEPSMVAFDDKREKAGGDWEHYRIVAQLMPSTMPTVDEKDPPNHFIQLGAPQTLTSSFVMKLPEGWGAELPEAIHEKAAFATYDLTFRFDKGTIYAERKVVVLQEHVPAGDWRVYQKWMDKAEPNSFPYIQLTRTNAKSGKDGGKDLKGSAGGPPAPSITNAEAAKLIQQAFTAMEKMNVDEAAPLLDKAKGLNDQERLLWAAYGYMAELRGAELEAATDYRKELALHPDSYLTYRSLVGSELRSRKRKEAMETLRSWQTADPADPAPAMQLSAMQLQDGHAADAVETMNVAIPKLPEEKRTDGRVILTLCNAERKNGMEDKAAASLVELLKTSDDSGILNDGAYYLSEMGRELPVAETAQRKALGQMDTETENWTLDEAPQVLTRKTSLLVAAWDTMGWILYREGKLPEARTFVEAAWINAGHGIVGEHLGDIEVAQGELTPAVQTFELAKKAGGPLPELNERQKKAQKAGGKNTSTDAEKELKELRTVKLGPANGKAGAAEYKILLAGGRVIKVEAVRDKTVDGGAEMIEKMQAPGWFPRDSPARLAKNGVLNCYAGECELIFEP